MPGKGQDIIQRKRAYLSSPPSEPDDDHDRESQEHKERGTYPRTLQDPLSALWDGRGRSPFKTPATAAIDSVRSDALLLQHLGREIEQQQTELTALIATKQRQLLHLQRDKVRLLELDMSASLGGDDRLVLRPVPTRSRSLSPEKFLAALPHGDPQILHRSLGKVGHQMPPVVKDTIKYFEQKLDVSCIPYQLKVAMCPHSTRGLSL